MADSEASEPQKELHLHAPSNNIAYAYPPTKLLEKGKKGKGGEGVKRAKRVKRDKGQKDQNLETKSRPNKLKTASRPKKV